MERREKDGARIPLTTCHAHTGFSMLALSLSEGAYPVQITVKTLKEMSGRREGCSSPMGLGA